MKMYSYKINYVCCFLSGFMALLSAATHQLGFLLINFFFAVFNWYVAGWKRRLENEKSGESTDAETKE